MNVLLAAINAKYIHSNLGIYSLMGFAREHLRVSGKAWGSWEEPVSIELAEYTVNHRRDQILQDICRRSPDILGFSCYIWNIEYVKALTADIKKILPGTAIWLGGPEVSYDSANVLREQEAVTGIIKGEGEESFAELVSWYVDKEKAGRDFCGKNPANSVSVDQYASFIGAKSPTKCGAHLSESNFQTRSRPALVQIPGLTFRLGDGSMLDTGLRPAMDMDRIPFPYGFMDLQDLKNRIVYYESSRGCPFLCSYCLSSIDKTVRFRSLGLVKEELSFFLNAGVPQVKFVDRTFNCKKSHAMEIWRFIQERDNGVTNFHFEIAADLLDQEETALLKSMRPGLIQLEIGVQSVNPATLKAIRRSTDIEAIRSVTSSVRSGGNIHQHLDLIAGLPYEDLESFKASFNEVYSMKPDQLQLGFLKVLKGSYMEEASASYGLACSSSPPYEVLFTRWLSYRDILELKGVEEMVEIYYNSSQFTNTLKMLETMYNTPYHMFQSLSRCYQKAGLSGLSHSRVSNYEFLYELVKDKGEPDWLEAFRDSLVTDLYLRENMKKRPSFARDLTDYKDRIREFFRQEEKCPRYLKGYGGYDYKQMMKMAHAEVLRDGALALFDYQDRDPLTGNARLYYP